MVENLPPHAVLSNTSSKRKDPSGFVMIMALALMGATLLATITMQLALHYGWQVL